MQVPDIDWDLTPGQAMQVQRDMARRVAEQYVPGTIHRVAGIDVGVAEGVNAIARAAVVVLRFPELTPVDSAVAERPISFPYVPGLLAFRECPVILDALRDIRQTPDVLIVDGHGRAHPRRMGIACHLGILMDLPSIGCAKSRLVGAFAMPADMRGAWEPLMEREEVIGAVVRTRPGTTPLFVSVGHRVTLERAVELVLQCTTRYRLPETTRHAHRLARGKAAQGVRGL